ncbi:MAG TPA: phosphogluconate dehydrogenase (NADP(+)-dependent, decarboxylating) [Cytophagales bacterium]|jgi:6-phosphogluconate dehydrogenase|nr:phosphogluconate dehydrogenase (NADP(+)-dependent, decarboxylating) [Cytophagales bacterium]
MATKYDFGLIGLGVMGRNFLLNVSDHGYSVAGLDRDPEKVEAFANDTEGKVSLSTTDAKEFVQGLSTPRKIMILVPAGQAVDAVIEQFESMLEPCDLLIDGGNSLYTDTNRRMKRLSEKDILYLGVGVSGGEEGARRGPSIMPGGDQKAYEMVAPILESVAAKVNDEPCVAYMGNTSAGNYVKMVHNGIEYGLMQLIAEVYDLLLRHGRLSNAELSEVFEKWNKGRLQSFLIEITSQIFKTKDDITGNSLVDMVLDKAKQKGTGKWTSQNAMDLGIATPTIDAAVSMRQISGQKDLRQSMSTGNRYALEEYNLDKEELINLAERALYFSTVVTYAQGFQLLSVANEGYKYELDMEAIARIWRGGCIIRAAFLEDIRSAYQQKPNLPHLFANAEIRGVLEDNSSATRNLMIHALQNRIPALALSSALNYYDAITTARLPLNLVQAQRDFFGAHTYERTDREGIFHSQWG